MSHLSLVTLLLLQFVANADFNVKHIDPNNKYGLYWNILNKSDCDKFGIKVDCIEIGLQVESHGWIGFGISNNGQMTESDIVIGWIDNNHKTYLQNRYTLNEHATPIFVDDISNRISSSQKIGNITQISFVREIQPCFTNNSKYIKRKIETGTTKIIYAWNDNLPNCETESQECEIESHGRINRGRKRINFFSADQDTEMPPNTQYYDIMNDNYSIPTVGTTYYCKFMRFNIANIDKLHHIIQIEPMIQKGNEKYVHHIIIQQCSKFPVTYLGRSCTESPQLKRVQCNIVFMEWAIGRQEFYLPKHVGLELGGPSSDRLEYLRVVWHYDNNLLIPNLFDNSGLRFYYTNILRENTAMIMGIQYSTYPIFIPSGIDHSITYGHCPSECTSQYDKYDKYDEKGINIISVAFHLHLTGIAGKLRHIRNGTELEPINENNAYDPTFQDFVLLKQERHIMAGDDMILECHYNTSNRILPTFGGQTSHDEMCIAWMIIYPKNDLNLCISRATRKLMKIFTNDATQKGYWHENKSYKYYNTTTKEAVQFYKDFQIQPYRSAHCGKVRTDFITPESKHNFIPYHHNSTSLSQLCKDNNNNNNNNNNNEEYNYYELNDTQSFNIISTTNMTFILVFTLFIWMGWNWIKRKNKNINESDVNESDVNESEHEMFLSPISNE